MRLYNNPRVLFKHGPKFRVLNTDDVARMKFTVEMVHSAKIRGILRYPDEELIAAMAEEIHFLQEQLRG